MDEVVNDLKALEQLLLRNTGGSYGISSHLFL
jgi:tetrahydromethanopterin S-methyltransferase subunit F